MNLEESQTQISSALNHAKCRSTNQSRESCSCTSRLEEQYQAAEEMSRSRKVAHRLPTYTTSSQNQLLIPRAVNSLWHVEAADQFCLPPRNGPLLCALLRGPPLSCQNNSFDAVGRTFSIYTRSSTIAAQWVGWHIHNDSTLDTLSTEIIAKRERAELVLTPKTTSTVFRHISRDSSALVMFPIASCSPKTLYTTLI